MTEETLRRTPLHAAHVALGARMVPFAGYEMPVQYASILDEHRTVRSAVGLFDLSHMGELHLSGPEALAFARYAVVSDPAALEPGQAQYSMLCAEDGGVIDDLILYRVADGYLVVCNASNHDAVLAQLQHLRQHGDFDAVIDDRSERTALIAPQGPRAAELLGLLTDLDLAGLGNYRSATATVAGIECLVARTGYTGEDGFELFCAARKATALWDALLSAGGDFGLAPCGLGARDTLRLEAGMPLYGNELDRTVNPYEANLGRVVKMEKGEFVGRAALAAVQQAGPRRRLVGLVMRDRAIARHGYPVLVDGREVGVVTSGTMSPSLDRPIAMAYLPPGDAAVGAEVAVMVRDRPFVAEQVKLPFYPPPQAGRRLSPSIAPAKEPMLPMYPDDLRYSKEHEWVRVDGSTATIGITSFAADELGDIVFVEAPESGAAITQFAAFGVVESVKAVSDLYAPISGRVIEVNAALSESPELLNSDPFGAGWIARVEITEPAELEALLDAAAYAELTAG